MSMKLRWGIWLFIAICLSLTINQKSYSAVSLNDPLVLKNSSLYSEGYNVDIVGDIAYVAMVSGLQIIEISNPSQPTLLSYTYLEYGETTDLTVSGDVAFITERGGYLYSIDISNPTNPTILQEYQLPNAYRLDVVGNIAYVGYGLDMPEVQKGVMLLDISNPSNISFISNIETEQTPRSVKVVDNHAYIAGGYLKIVDVTIPAVPIVLSNTSTGYYTIGIDVVDSMVYLSELYPIITEDPEGNLTIYNAADKANPAFLSRLNLYSASYNVIASGDNVFMAGSNVFTIDITDPNQPVKTNTYYIPANGCRIDVDNDKLAFIDFAQFYYPQSKPGDLHILDISNPTAFTFLGKFKNPENIHNFTGGNGYLYALNKETFGERIYITELGGQEIIATYNTTAIPLMAKLVDTLLFVGTTEGMEILNAADPINLQLIKLCPTGVPVNDIFVKDSFAYIAANDSGLQVFNISDSSTIPITVKHESGRVVEIAVLGNYLYLTNSSYPTSIYDLSLPFYPNFVSKIGSTINTEIAVGNNHLYLQNLRFLEIYDLVDGANPQLLSTFYDSLLVDSTYGNIYFGDIFSYNNHLAVANERAGISIIDVSNPHDLTVTERFRTTGAAINIAVIDDYLVTTDENSIIYYGNDIVLDFDDPNPEILPTTIALSQNYPNPFNPATTIAYNLASKSEVKLEVFNILGQKVATLVNENQPAGQYSINWNADSFSSGIYLYRLETNQGTLSKKMILLK